MVRDLLTHALSSVDWKTALLSAGKLHLKPASMSEDWTSPMSGDNHHRNPTHNLIQRSYDGCCRGFRQTDNAIRSRSGYVCLFERIEYDACCKSLDHKAERKHRNAVKNISLDTEMIGEIATHAMTPTILKNIPQPGWSSSSMHI